MKMKNKLKGISQMLRQKNVGFGSVILLFLVMNCMSSDHDFPLQIGETIDVKTLTVLEEKGIMVSSGSIAPGYVIDYSDVVYNIVLEDGKLVFVTVRDTNFKTPEGVYVGKSLSELDIENGESATIEPGWGAYFELKSGWKAGYSDKGKSVEWLFKRASVIDNNKKIIKTLDLN